MFDYLATFNPKLNGQGIGWNETYLIQVYSYFPDWKVYIWERSSNRGDLDCIDISKDSRFNFVDYNDLLDSPEQSTVKLDTANLHQLLNHLTRLNNMKVFL